MPFIRAAGADVIVLLISQTPLARACDAAASSRTHYAYFFFFPPSSSYFHDYVRAQVGLLSVKVGPIKEGILLLFFFLIPPPPPLGFLFSRERE